MLCGVRNTTERSPVVLTCAEIVSNLGFDVCVHEAVSGHSYPTGQRDGHQKSSALSERDVEIGGL